MLYQTEERCASETRPVTIAQSHLQSQTNKLSAIELLYVGMAAAQCKTSWVHLSLLFSFAANSNSRTLGRSVVLHTMKYKQSINQLNLRLKPHNNRGLSCPPPVCASFFEPEGQVALPWFLTNHSMVWWYSYNPKTQLSNGHKWLFQWGYTFHKWISMGWLTDL